MKLYELKLKARVLLPVFLFSVLATDVTASVEKDIDDIVKSMSLEQKAQLVVGTGMYFPLPDSIREQMPPMFGGGEREESDYTRMVDKIRQYLPGTAGITAEFPELGITSQALADGPAGLRISPIREGDSRT